MIGFRHARTLLIGGIVGLATAPAAGAQTDGTSPAQAAIRDRVEALVGPLVDARDFAGTILIALGADTLFLQSYGSADVALDVPNRPDTPMRIGSISKQFTAAVILLLEEEGRLSVSDPLSRFLPEVPRGDEITIHHLLTHQSGVIRDVFGEWEERLRPRSLIELTAEISTHPLDFEPGAQTSYSNAGYTLLARVVEIAAGAPFGDVLAARVFVPLGMTRTGLWDPAVPIRGMARGYDPGPAPHRLAHTPHEEPSNIFGAGGIVSTAGDLHAWSEALETDAVLSEASRGKMLRAYAAGRGYGIAVSADGRHVGHDGITHGFIASLDRDLETNLTVVLMGNIRTGVLSGLRTALGAIATGQPHAPVTRPDLVSPPPRDRLARCVGTYELFPGFRISISERDGELYLLGTGGYPTVLDPVDDRTWFYRARYETIRFEEAEGRVTGLTWIDRAGQTYDAPRIDDGPR